MSVAAISLLNAYDPATPSSLDSALTGAGLSDTYYTQGVNGTGLYDPGTQAPVAAPPAAPAPAPSSGLNLYQQSLASLQQWSAQTLISAALGSGSAGDSSTDLTTALQNAAAQQQSTQAAQQQAALTAAQAALTGSTVDAAA